MSGQDAVGIAVAVLGYVGLFAAFWLVERRAKARVRREKMTGRLPARRPNRRPVSMSPVPAMILVGIWAFLPMVLWMFSHAIRLGTPASTRPYLPPIPPLSQAIRSNLVWCLIWAGLASLVAGVVWIVICISRRIADPAVSRAEKQLKVGDFDGAVRGLRESIEAKGPSPARRNALVEALTKQERWMEVLEISLDIEERSPLDDRNRHRKALALYHLGMPEIALAEIDRSTTARSERIHRVCSFCHALIDLRLFDRAWDQLRRAEVIFGRCTLPEADVPGLREQIDACRARLSKHYPDPKSDGFDEL